MRLSPDELSRVIRGGLDRDGQPQVCAQLGKVRGAWTWAEARQLAMTTVKADAIIRMILKVLRNGSSSTRKNATPSCTVCISE